MDELSHALNLGSQRIPSSNFRLRRPTEGVPPPPLSILCLYTCRFTGPAGISSRLYGAGSHANQNHTNGARHIVRFGHKTMPIVRKKFSNVRNGQSRRMYKRKANNRPANCCSLANRHSAGMQRKMIRTNRGRGLESIAGPPVSDKPCIILRWPCLTLCVLGAKEFENTHEPGFA